MAEFEEKDLEIYTTLVDPFLEILAKDPNDSYVAGIIINNREALTHFAPQNAEIHAVLVIARQQSWWKE